MAKSNVVELPSRSFVYVIGDPEGPQKVGLAANVNRRLLHLQIGNHRPLVCAARFDIAADQVGEVERYAHWLLRPRHIRGEWFDVTPAEAGDAVRKAIDAVARGLLAPSDTPGGPGRQKRWSEDMQARFPEGTFARIAAVLADGEDRTDFVREAVERELARREPSAKAS